MDKKQATDLIRLTFPQAFDKARFCEFAANVLNRLDQSKARRFKCPSSYIKEAFRPHVRHLERLGTYASPAGETLDVLVVRLAAESKLERARTALRNFVADHLKQRDEKDAALVAFVSPSEKQWRLSYVRMDYASVRNASGDVAVETRLTPARRFSYLVGEGESCHTAQTRFLALLQNTTADPTLADIEKAFSVEAVTKEFFQYYVGLFERIRAALDALVAADPDVRGEFRSKNLNTVDFAKKLLGQIVFLYFIQKKGWLGVPKGQEWGEGPRDFLRQTVGQATSLFNPKVGQAPSLSNPPRNDAQSAAPNIFNDILEPLFYDTFATDRGHEAWCPRFNSRIPFLNGGLFEPPGGYDWRNVDIRLPDELFTNQEAVEEGVVGTGVFDVFDRYNFTVNEAEPLEKDVAIDPEMLGKVFENLIEENRRKGLGAFYTPREIVHYMCQESLVNYLGAAVNRREGGAQGELVPRADIETFLRLGEQFSHYESAKADYGAGFKMPRSVRENARALDEAMRSIAVCDPAVGSGAFPVGMMNEIVRARSALTPFFNDPEERTPYQFKRHAIQNCLYGVDIDPGAVEIAKLRLWLSLVVDEDDVKRIKPLPNLDYKVVAGDSLLGVEKALYNNQQRLRLEALKPKFFAETDHLRKAELKEEIDALIHELTHGSEMFDFEIYFSEVFHAKGGFDVVIGNPPYLESRSPAFSSEMKNRLQSAIRKRWPRISITDYIPRGSDLLIYFFETGVRLVSNTGILALITQNAWLDTEYGKKFQKFLLKHTQVSLIADSDFKHFDSIDGPNINTVISYFVGRSPRKDGYTTFARFQRPFEVGALPLPSRDTASSNCAISCRRYKSSDQRLIHSKWGLLLSQDEVVINLLSLLAKKAKPLGRIGGTTLSFGQGLNLPKSFFFPYEQREELDLKEQALIPILTSADAPSFKVANTANCLVDRAQLTQRNLINLEKHGYQAFDRSSTKKRPPVLLMPRGIGRHYCALNTLGAFSSSFVEVYSIPTLPDENSLYSLWAIFNSSVVWLIREAVGRKNLGGGMLKAEAIDLKEVPLFMEIDATRALKENLDALCNRNVLDTLQEIETPEHSAIDDLVFGHLGLSQNQRKQIKEALIHKIVNRMAKSKT